MLTYISTNIIGSIFLITGIAKALHSKEFIIHNYRYQLFPQQFVPTIALSFIALESALGIALILHCFPQWLIPSAIVLLIGLSALTYWATKSDRTEDCGCYGGLVIITPTQSLFLNLGYSLLLTTAWLFPVPNHHTAPWQWILALSIGIAAATLGWFTREKPLVNFSRLKIGNRWKQRWLKQSPNNLQQGSHFIVFLSKDCPYCKRWVPFLNMIQTQKDMPKPMGVMVLTPEDIETFKTEQAVRFPIVSMDKLLMKYMVDAYPTAVLIEEGIITNQWMGEVPTEFLDRIKQMYEKMFAPKVPVPSDPSH
jgi:thioredoxin-related protein